jgi:hypothetical protein
MYVIPCGDWVASSMAATDEASDNPADELSCRLEGRRRPPLAMAGSETALAL